MKIIVTMFCLLCTAISIACLVITLRLDAKASTILARADSLNKRSQVLLQEFGVLDRRIKKQEGIRHGYGH